MFKKKTKPLPIIKVNTKVFIRKKDNNFHIYINLKFKRTKMKMPQALITIIWEFFCLTTSG